MAFFSLFKTERPVELRNMGLYYLTVIDVSLTDVWHKDQVIGGQHNKRSVESMKKVTISRIVHKRLCKGFEYVYKTLINLNRGFLRI